MSQDTKTIDIIQSLIDSSSISSANFVEDIDVSETSKNEIIVGVSFNPKLPTSSREIFFNEIWDLVFNYLGIPIFVKDKTPSKKINENEDKNLSILKKFVSEYELEGTCGFWVDEERDDHDVIWVYIVFDIDWLNDNKHQTKPEFVVRRYKLGLKEEIKKYLNIDVNVGSLSLKCKDSFI